MSKLYIVTGANGHLGNTVVKKLLERGERVRALVLPTEENTALSGTGAEIIRGDVRDLAALSAALFDGVAAAECIVIHAAGIVMISAEYKRNVYDVNVTGTENIVKICKEHNAGRLVYVSSVHAIAEEKKGAVMRETKNFSPDTVKGLYAKTKAAATRAVLEGVRDGLDAVIVHPSGIIGPGDYGTSHTTQLLLDYFSGRLTACVKGGYDFVDVRDVADGIIAAAKHGKSGECYILSNAFITVSEIFALLHEIGGGRKIKTVLPLWFARMTAPLAEVYYWLRRTKPLYTKYSLDTLQGNAEFSHAKATAEFGYSPRTLRETLQDTYNWLVEIGRIKPKQLHC